MSAAGSLTVEQGEQLVMHVYNGDTDAIADLLDDAQAAPVFVLSFLADMAGGVARMVAGGEAIPGGAAIEGLFAFPASRNGSPVPQWLQLVAAAINEDEAMVTAHVQTICKGSASTYRTALVQIMGMLRDLLHMLSDRNAK